MNHDRLQSSAKQENTGEGAKLLAFMLKESFSNSDVAITFDSNKIIDDADPDLTIINLHGDKPVDKSSGQEIAWNLGNPNKFNLIFTGHFHSRKQESKNDGLNFRKIALPSFCPPDNYGKTVAFGSLPSVTLISSDKNGLPMITDLPLYYDRT